MEILRLLENLEIDAGVTYLDNEPLGRVTGVPLYRERYRLLTAADAPLGDRDKVTWAEVAQVPLCLLTPDMQNRRIIEPAARRRRRSEADARIEFDDRALLPCPHRALGERDAGAARRDTRPHRQCCARSRSWSRKRAIPSAWWCRRGKPMKPLTAALVAEARRRLAPLFGRLMQLVRCSAACT